MPKKIDLLQHNTNVLSFKGPRRIIGLQQHNLTIFTKIKKKTSLIFQTYDYDYTQNIASVVLPGMTPEGKRTEFRPLSDHDGLIGQDKTIMTSKMMIIGQD